MATRLQLKEIQQLTISPVMRHCIELLATSRMEFLERLQLESETNPMIDIDYGENPVAESREEPRPERNAYEKRMERADSSYVSNYEEQGFFKRDPDELDKNRALEILTPQEETFTDALYKQALTRFDNEKEVEIARHIIYNLDNDGYLKLEIESVAQLLHTTPQEIERIRQAVMAFDPPGCGARDLKECLCAQLGDDERDQKIRRLITHHLEDLARSRYDVIQKSMGIGLEELMPLISRLKKLNPRPAEALRKEAVEYAEVDLMLLREGNEFRVVYVDEGLPQVTLSQYYREMLDKAKDKKTVSYLKERYRDANYFIEGIELRKRTILKIAEYLVKAQKDFLLFGEKWKKPLTMKDVAHEISLNESTISRSVNNKFIATEKGLISLKSFFSYSIKGDFGFSHSVDTIRDKIREIIQGEDANHPLSDEDIARKLSALGIRIARRTVRNYREEMNIPSSFIRKKELQIKGVKR